MNAIVDAINTLLQTRTGNLALTSAGSTITLGGDTNLYRNGAGALKTDGTLTALDLGAFAAASGNEAAFFSVTGDANRRLQILGDGTLRWGNGTAAVDTFLYRSSAGVLKTDGQLQVQGNITINGGTSVLAQSGGLSLDFDGVNYFLSTTGHNRLVFAGDATVNLYRGAAGFLKTDGNFVAGSGLYVGNGVNGTTPAFGIQFGLSTDTNLYRDIAGRLATDGQLRFTSGNGYVYFNALSSAANQPVQIAISGDTQNRFQIYADGKMAWGPGGSTAPDTLLYRQGGQVLRVQGSTYGDLLSIAPTSANLDTTIGVYYRNASGVEVNARATLGAADSGGVGFRVLRVPN